MNSDTIRSERRGTIAVLTLNRPDRFNTFNSELADALNEALAALDRDDAVRAVVVRGEGKVFSTGIDLAEFAGQSPEEYRAWIARMNRMHLVIAALGKPVIAMAHGYAVANGAGLLAAADFAVVAEGTRIGTSAINVGLLCSGPIVPLSYGLGKKRALELLLGGELLDAREAERLGLVNRVVPAARLEEETLALANRLAAKSPTALRAGKRFYYRMIDLPLAERLRLATEVLAELCTTADAREGVQAFLEKRPPVWPGR
ncbi:MAG: enoyl-CoA hydratase/isomerase family protein [Planctomycetes bacterium]|nr:enoyl-CoA hydratase/isomerase family protein [Planctomycetota bacterium]